MSLDCRLFAVGLAEMEELKAHPGLVLGRLLFAGMPLCDLPDAGRAMRLILSDRGSTENAGVGSLFQGVELPVPSLAGLLPRLLDYHEVKALNAVLRPVDERELQRRFNHQSLVASVLERIDGETAYCEEARDFSEGSEEEFPGSEEEFEEDWTLAEAEEFERIAHQVEVLREFVGLAARCRQCLVVALHEAEC
jgi:hypothetical protein